LLYILLMWLANGLTVARIPLAAVFWATYGRVEWSILAIVLAAATDALDGRIARRARARIGAGAGHAGEWLDPVADKIFVFTVAASIVAHGDAPWALAVLVLARELVIVPAGIVYRLVLVHRPPVEHAFQADALGKATTIVQLAAVLALVTRAPVVGPVLAVAAAVLGLAAAVHYVVRAKSTTR
jgi:phosphatidylglycerophosphate synthase